MERQTMESFKWDGRDYQQFSKYQTEEGIKLIELLNVRNGESILDVGCGNGLLTLDIAKNDPKGLVLGIDSSGDMLKKAEENKREQDVGNVDFQLKDAPSVDYENRFDAIFSNSVLHWIKDHGELLTRFYKALKPGGRVALGFASRGNIDSFLEIINHIMEDDEFSTSFKGFNFSWYFPGKEYNGLLKDAGFERCELKFKSVEIRMTKEELMGWFRTVGMPYWGHLPEPLSGEFFDRVIDEYIKSRQGKGIAIVFKRVIVRGIRKDSHFNKELSC
ncbi:MAG TPA: class I SAM-dependent methyltransferase [Nitrospirae bacterium]|nr:class I SAM-dependent methyltransferase [Nitrospirota bacterium]